MEGLSLSLNCPSRWRGGELLPPAAAAAAASSLLSPKDPRPRAPRRPSIHTIGALSALPILSRARKQARQTSILKNSSRERVLPSSKQGQTLALLLLCVCRRRSGPSTVASPVVPARALPRRSTGVVRHPGHLVAQLGGFVLAGGSGGGGGREGHVVLPPNPCSLSSSSRRRGVQARITPCVPARA